MTYMALSPCKHSLSTLQYIVKRQSYNKKYFVTMKQYKTTLRHQFLVEYRVFSIKMSPFKFGSIM